MAINYVEAVKNSRLQVVADALSAGVSNGVLEIGTTGMASILATIALNDPAGTIAGGVLTLGGFPKTATAGASGTAAAARFKDSGGAIVADGLTVGTGTADIVMDSVDVTSGQTVQINSAAITHG